ncbi:MAG: glycine cleavage system protein H [Alphaproteobacteria bacterium TMED87]|nr:glycine cleavage system protein H [Rhodospirillaceae bacterium]OUV09323.1 MAG: glycine cleavage system protein H [Alphaproteobacteria bacterium TMED87]|tara:strand:- start:251 stop:631 length:381 start_codon:yes stop_codon:yes gene_type:complete
MEGYFYTKEHEWVTVRDDTATVGITDFAQKQLGDIVFIEFPSLGSVYSQGDEISVIESVKAASEIYAPISGKVITCNDAVEGSPDLVNLNPEGDGWLFKISEIESQELNSLLSHSEYEEYIKKITE